MSADASDDGHAPLGLTERLRVARFAVIAIALFLVPLAPYVSPHPATAHMGWRMYHDRGLGLCLVRYTRVGADGHASTIDHVAAFGFSARNPPPDALLRITSRDEARVFARELCDVLGAEDVRLHMRCATRAGYHVVSRGEQNECPR